MSDSKVTISSSSSSSHPKEETLHLTSLTGYRFSWTYELRYWLLALCTCFLSCLLSYWFPRRLRGIRYVRASLSDAEYIDIQTDDDSSSVEFLMIEPISTHSYVYVPSTFGKIWYGPTSRTTLGSPHYIQPEDRMFIYHHMRYFYDSVAGSYVKQSTAVLTEPGGVLQQRLTSGLSTREHHLLQTRLGINQLQIIVPTYPSLLMRELFHPFFIFQIYSVILWCFEAYYIFALCIAVIASVSIVTTLLETRERLTNLSNLARYEVNVRCIRDGKLEIISSSELVIGDIIEIEVGIIPCDLSVISGGAVVNESMLTGESIPVIKTAVVLPYDQKAPVTLGVESRSTLYSATKILQLKPSPDSLTQKVYGIVVRTGFLTTKGELILSILYPRPSSFKFVSQSFKFIGLLFIMSLFGFAISIWQLNKHDASIKTMIIRGLDLITIVVPPSLPLALSVGVNFALISLKHMKIFCIAPSRINLAGKIQWMCFDKTGTLTQEGMEMMGVLPVKVKEGSHEEESKEEEQQQQSRFTDFYHITKPKSQSSSSLSLPSSTLHISSSLSSPAIPVTGSPVHVKNGRLIEHEHLKASDDSTLSDGDVDEESQMRLGGGGSKRGSLIGGSVGEDEIELSYPTHGDSSSLSSRHHQPPLPLHTLTCMSVCHSLASLDGVLIGDPLEIEIFESTTSILEDSDKKEYVSYITHPLSLSALHSHHQTNRVGIHTQFEFSSGLQRMSVITRHLQTDEMFIYVKGSPEMISSLCLPHTIPQDFNKSLRTYVHKGFRVIAIAYKPLHTDDNLVPHIEKEQLRAQCESDLIFLGLIVLENAVKPETKPTLGKLHQACVRSVMVTGDNALTGISVAKECGIIVGGGEGEAKQHATATTKVFLGTLTSDPRTGEQTLEWIDTAEIDDSTLPLKLDPHTFQLDSDSRSRLRLQHGQEFKYELAVTGTVYAYLQSRYDAELQQRRMQVNMTSVDYITALVKPGGTRRMLEGINGNANDSAIIYFYRVILNCMIFSRMTPDQKASLIGYLQELGIYTGMCGDGANDVGALKAGHIGVSLSDSEASIAAPFTYQRPNIECIPLLLNEGRSALQTSFQLFKYMAMYSMIQFSAVILLYFKGSVLGNWEYLYQDMFLVFPLTIAIGNTTASKVLSIKRPSGNLLSKTNIACVLGHMLICFSFQIFVFEISQKQDDFVSYSDVPGFDNGPQTYESTSMYLYSNFQYILMAVLFARGAPWKSSILTNRKFMGWVVLSVIISFLLLFSRDQSSFFRSEEVPVGGTWRGLMCLIMIFDVLANTAFNLFIFPFIVGKLKEMKSQEWKKVSVYGKRKPGEGPNAKLWHQLRGEFEAGWRGEGQ